MAPGRGTRPDARPHLLPRLGQIVAMAGAGAACAYGAYVAFTWARYGRPSPPAAWDRDALLDQFIPVYDVVERHHALVNGPPEAVLQAACAQPLSTLPIVRVIFRARALLMRSTPEREGPGGLLATSPGLLAETTGLGWVVLAERPGREVVVGAVTRPWEADVTFRGIAPERFADFAEPAYVKIVWTLRVNPAGPGRSIFRTETRAVATDAEARRRFRWYWAFLSPGIIGIRWLAAAHLKARFRRTAPKFESAIQQR